jgi:hypothetical protein
MLSNNVYKIIILPTLVIRIPNLEIFLFCQHNSTGGGNLELIIIIIIIIIIFIRTPPNRYRTRQTYTRTKYVQQNMYNKIAKHNTRCFSNTTHNKSRSNQSNYIYFNLMYQSCPSENPRNCSRLSLEETFLCLF